MKLCQEEMEWDHHLEVVEPGKEEVLVEAVVEVAGWEVHVLGLDPVGSVSAPTVAHV